MEIKAADFKDKLPDKGKKNCKECGVPTCFAFAMKLAKGSATLDQCPHLDPEAREWLTDLLTPPMKLVTIGTGENELSLGGEEAMFRHEKAFRHEPAIALLISDKDADAEIDLKLKHIKEMVFERTGETIKANLLALKFASGNRGRFEELVKKAYDASDLSAVIISEDLDALFWARDCYRDRNPVIYPVTGENVEAAIPRIKENLTPVGVRTDSIDALIPLTNRLNEAGIDKLVLDPSPRDIYDGIRDYTLIRRSALKAKVRLLGYPTIAFPCFLTDDRRKETLLASIFMAKYAGIIVLSSVEADHLFPLLLQRMDIYSDPRSLRTVEQKVYEINHPREDSPVLVTTNAALTYFAVSADLDQGKVPAYLAVIDTEGFSVETALGAGRFGGEKVAGFIKESGVVDNNTLKKIIIPRQASIIKRDMETELPGWDVILGPGDAKEITAFLKKEVL